MLRNEILSKIPFSVKKKCYSRNLSIYNSWLSTTGRQTLRQFFYARKNSNLDSFNKESKWSDNLLGHVYSCLQISSKVGIKYFVSQINISTRRSGKWFVLSLKRIRIDILDIMIDMELATNLLLYMVAIELILFKTSYSPTSHPLWIFDLALSWWHILSFIQIPDWLWRTFAYVINESKSLARDPYLQTQSWLKSAPVQTLSPSVLADNFHPWM